MMDNYHLVVLNGYIVDQETLIHEISHVIDARVEWDARNREDALYKVQCWMALQPEGFYYAMRN